MNELKTYQSESDPEVRMTKKVLKGNKGYNLFQQCASSFLVAQS